MDEEGVARHGLQYRFVIHVLKPNVSDLFCMHVQNAGTRKRARGGGGCSRVCV